MTVGEFFCSFFRPLEISSRDTYQVCTSMINYQSVELTADAFVINLHVKHVQHEYTYVIVLMLRVVNYLVRL